jgi:pyruvate/2-oxoglutarate dehydrogenase complex dihydrolipoamide acyltransferase (E2) component
VTGVLAAEFLLDDGTSVHVLGELVVIGKDGKHATLPVTSAAFLSRVLVSIDELHRPQSVAATPAPSVGEDAARTSASPAAGRPPGVAESSPPSSSATPARAHTRVSSPVGTPREVAAALARRPRRASSGH